MRHSKGQNPLFITMPKKPPDKKRNLKSILVDEQAEEAAERLADLIWRHWLYMKEEEKKKARKR